MKINRYSTSLYCTFGPLAVLCGFAYAQNPAVPAKKLPPEAKAATIVSSAEPGKDTVTGQPQVSTIRLGGRIIAAPDAISNNGRSVNMSPNNQHSPTLQDAVVAGAIGELGLALIRNESVTSGNADQNLLISPLSIASAVGMLHAGARDTTASELAALIDATPAGGRAFSRGLPRLYRQLATHAPGVEFTSANRVWVAKSLVPVVSDFYAQLVRQRFGADGAALDFSRPEPSRHSINAWVSDSTKGKIRDLMPAGSVTANTRLVLTNAVYFKGKWQTPFNSLTTTMERFNGPSGRMQDVATMIATRTVRTAVVDNLQVYELPYTGNEFALYIALVPLGHTLNALETDLTGVDIVSWDSQLKSQECELHLPKFKIQPTSTSLKGALGLLGVKAAFGPSADFTSMLGKETKSIFVDDVFHSAMIIVDEEGSEAAAATAAVMRTKSVVLNPPVCRVDRPFIFAVVHKQTGTPLILGKVAMPAFN